MASVLPLFNAHYSIGRSILTLEKTEEESDNSPDSVFALAKQSNLKKIFLIDDTMSGFLQAFSNAQEMDLSLIFGLRISICSDLTQKNEEARKETCKYVIIAKNNEGYKRLIKIYTLASQDGFYYVPRIDFKNLNKLWNEKDLQLAIPFYDSFIFNNIMGHATCIPDFSKIKPVFFIESNNLPFDKLVEKRVHNYAKDKYDTVNTQSIFYKEKRDFKAYLTFRCINNRSTLGRPNLDHMSSNECCLESWREKNG